MTGLGGRSRQGAQSGPLSERTNRTRAQPHPGRGSVLSANGERCTKMDGIKSGWPKKEVCSFATPPPCFQFSVCQYLMLDSVSGGDPVSRLLWGVGRLHRVIEFRSLGGQ